MTFQSKILKNSNSHENYIMYEDESMELPPIKTKKRRLDHLSWEEKLQRKKLKNRVAAQTSRDRKKAKMENLERSFEELMSKNEKVLAECEDLKKLNEKLMAENVELHKKLRQPCWSCQSNQNQSVECVEPLTGSTESTILLQQGVTTHSAVALKAQTAAALVKILMACLLYKSSLKSSTSISISRPSSPTLSNNCWQISPQTWRHLLRKQISKNREIVCQELNLQKWWGRHQNNWNPVETTA